MASSGMAPTSVVGKPTGNATFVDKLPMAINEMKIKDEKVEKEMEATVVDGNGTGTGHIIVTTIGGRNGQPKQTTWTWKREPMQSLKARISVYLHSDVLDDIKARLKECGDSVLQQFEQSCFGHFLRFHSGAYSCNVALHAIMSRQINKLDAPDDEIWFRIGGQFIRFSKYEYALVTGLSFGSSTFDPNGIHNPPVDGVHARRLGGKPILLRDLWDRFNMGHYRQPTGDALKVAKVLFVYCMLFGVDTKKSTIDPWVWTLVEDTDRWESFPWGKYTFQMLLHYIGILPVSALEDSDNVAYHFYGFSTALLIWAYEAIPSLGKECGQLLRPTEIPRCLRWDFPKKMKNLIGFFNQHVDAKETLSPSLLEQKRLNFLPIEDDLSEGIQYLAKENPIKQRSSTSRAIGRGPVGGLRSKRSATSAKGARKWQKVVSGAREEGHRAPVSDPDGAVSDPVRVSETGPRHDGGMDSLHEDSMDPSQCSDAPGECLREEHIDEEQPTVQAEYASATVDDEAFMTRLIEGLTPVIRREVDRAVGDLERRLPTIIRRELIGFFRGLLANTVATGTSDYERRCPQGTTSFFAHRDSFAPDKQS
ncbi:hypothetical protein PTKIN_Ptkin08bG0032200 [Pterospermum kingtungense]